MTSHLTAVHRLTSWAVDVSVLLLAAGLLVAVLPAVVATLLAFCAYLCYTVALPMKGYHTLGHIALGLRPVRVDSDSLGWLELGSRSALVLLLAAPCMVGMIGSTIAMLSRPDCRAWHDLGTGTTMAKVKPWDFSRQFELTAQPTVGPASSQP